MCGICGYIQAEPTGPDDEVTVVDMRDEMIHRGPDGQGSRVGDWYAMAHRRLSIIDLSAKGTQPMRNEDGTVWITFNGEIYNHLKIRSELESRGHVFRSQTDTEVIVHGWEEWGEKIVDRLNGMFAFCIADERAATAFFARDRLGIKPLYYFLRNGVFGFASEVKSLLRHPACPRQVCYDVMGEYLLFRNVAGARTLFEGIIELLPGTRLTLDRSLNARLDRYWHVGESEPDPEVAAMTPDDFLTSLKCSVERRMMSDVPLGIQLSGGLDSSVVTKLARELSPHPLKTFSIGFKEAKYSELSHAQRVADAVGTDHCPILVQPGDFERELDAMVWFCDVPIDHPNSVFLHLLCKRAKEDVTVLLTGEGADELLGGYSRYASYDQVMKKVAALPELAKWLLRRYPGAWTFWKIGLVKNWLIHGGRGMALRSGAFGSPRLLSMLSNDLQPDWTERERIYDGCGADSPTMNTLLRYDQQVYLVSILHRQDRVSMGASVEARVPFLDHTLVERVNAQALPTKLRGSETKWILKQAAKSLLSERIVNRTKMGFPVPINEWFRKDGGLYPQLAILDEQDSFVSQLFGRPGISRLIEEHGAGKRNHTEDLWILLSLELWKRRFIDSPSRSAARQHCCVTGSSR